MNVIAQLRSSIDDVGDETLVLALNALEQASVEELEEIVKMLTPPTSPKAAMILTIAHLMLRNLKLEEQLAQQAIALRAENKEAATTTLSDMRKKYVNPTSPDNDSYDPF